MGEDALDLISRESISTPERDKLRTLLREKTREIGEKGGIDRFEFTERNELAELADFEVTIVYGDGTREQDSVSLLKEDGKWRIRAEK